MSDLHPLAMLIDSDGAMSVAEIRAAQCESRGSNHNQNPWGPQFMASLQERLDAALNRQNSKRLPFSDLDFSNSDDL